MFSVLNILMFIILNNQGKINDNNNYNQEKL